MSQISPDLFVTVVSVGIEGKTQTCIPKKAINNSEYITVFTIGNEETKTINDVCEEIVIYRLPGERLGFGLKFEGGTKAQEFVKRLFIQSCAPDSPASRVQSSWGQLGEGDEVLEIDSVPVSSMTRIDCVRFLKDSNVAIKLLVKHCFNTQCTKPSDDLSVIVSTEEKKPPPVPPRKLHKKLHKNLQNIGDNVHDNIVPTIKQLESFSNKSARLQSPRSSFRKKYSPDVLRRLSGNCSLGPPDAEVYIDLISQESTQSLSESDDTGSTISTVLDRFASFPTTTTSSFAGSLPSTPTSIQKRLDLSYIIDDFPDDDLLPVIDKKFNRIEENNNIILDEPDDEYFKCLHEVKVKDATKFFYPQNNNSNSSSPETPKRPVIIPRSRDRVNNVSSNDSSVTLPRLVDFVPKLLQKDLEASVENVKRFLDNERFDFEYGEDSGLENDEDYNMDSYGSKWILSSHLSTIGEDDEEQHLQDSFNTFGYLATRCTLTELHYNYRVGISTLSKNINFVCSQIWNIFRPLYFKEMEQKDWSEVANEFQKKANFPQCLSAIDGKHIRIENFPHAGSMNFNYKKYYSVVLLAIADVDYCFLFVDIRAYGKDCDSSIPQSTEFWRRLTSGKLNIPEARPLTQKINVKVPYVFVADNAFPMNEHILKDFSNNNLNIKQRVFNYRLHRARRYVKCAFGILSNKWRIFHRSLNVSKIFSKNIIKACVVLHNIIRKRDGYRTEDLITSSGSKLQNLSPTQTTSKTGQGVRTCFANYFVSEAGQLPWQLPKFKFY